MRRGHPAHLLAVRPCDGFTVMVCETAGQLLARGDGEIPSASTWKVTGDAASRRRGRDSGERELAIDRFVLHQLAPRPAGRGCPSRLASAKVVNSCVARAGCVLPDQLSTRPHRLQPEEGARRARARRLRLSLVSGPPATRPPSATTRRVDASERLPSRTARGRSAGRRTRVTRPPGSRHRALAAGSRIGATPGGTDSRLSISGPMAPQLHAVTRFPSASVTSRRVVFLGALGGVDRFAHLARVAPAFERVSAKRGPKSYAQRGVAADGSPPKTPCCSCR